MTPGRSRTPITSRRARGGDSEGRRVAPDEWVTEAHDAIADRIEVPAPDLEEPAVYRPQLSGLYAAVRRWRGVVVLGVAFVLATTFVLLTISPPPFTADVVLLFDQPAATALGAEGQATAQKLLDLIPTYAEIATGDAVIGNVRRDLHIDAPITTVRSRVRVVPVEKELAVRITAHDSDPRHAEQLAQVMARDFAAQMDTFQAQNGVAPTFRLVITPLQTPHASRPSRHTTRTLIVSGVMGLLVMVGVALLLDYINRG